MVSTRRPWARALRIDSRVSCATSRLGQDVQQLRERTGPRCATAASRCRGTAESWSPPRGSRRRRRGALVPGGIAAAAAAAAAVAVVAAAGEEEAGERRRVVPPRERLLLLAAAVVDVDSLVEQPKSLKVADDGLLGCREAGERVVATGAQEAEAEGEGEESVGLHPRRRRDALLRHRAAAAAAALGLFCDGEVGEDKPPHLLGRRLQDVRAAARRGGPRRRPALRRDVRHLDQPGLAQQVVEGHLQLELKWSIQRLVAGSPGCGESTWSRRVSTLPGVCAQLGRRRRLLVGAERVGRRCRRAAPPGGSPRAATPSADERQLQRVPSAHLRRSCARRGRAVRAARRRGVLRARLRRRLRPRVHHRTRAGGADAGEPQLREQRSGVSGASAWHTQVVDGVRAR